MTGQTLLLFVERKNLLVSFLMQYIVWKRTCFTSKIFRDFKITWAEFSVIKKEKILVEKKTSEYIDCT